MKRLRQGRASHRAHRVALLLRALHERENGDYDAVGADLGALLDFYPDAPEARQARFYLAESYAERGRWTDAADEVKAVYDAEKAGKELTTVVETPPTNIPPTTSAIMFAAICSSFMRCSSARSLPSARLTFPSVIARSTSVSPCSSPVAKVFWLPVTSCTWFPSAK